MQAFNKEDLFSQIKFALYDSAIQARRIMIERVKKAPIVILKGGIARDAVFGIGPTRAIGCDAIKLDNVSGLDIETRKSLCSSMIDNDLKNEIGLFITNLRRAIHGNHKYVVDEIEYTRPACVREFVGKLCVPENWNAPLKPKVHILSGIEWDISKDRSLMNRKSMYQQINSSNSSNAKSNPSDHRWVSAWQGVFIDWNTLDEMCRDLLIDLEQEIKMDTIIQNKPVSIATTVVNGLPVIGVPDPINDRIDHLVSELNQKEIDMGALYVTAGDVPSTSNVLSQEDLDTIRNCKFAMGQLDDHLSSMRQTSGKFDELITSTEKMFTDFNKDMAAINN